jgi:predicted exporter
LGSRIDLRLDLRDFLPERRAAMDPMHEEIVERFGSVARVVVFLESEARIPLQDAAPVLEHLAGEIGRLEGVGSVRYRLSPALRRFLAEEGPKRFALYLEPAHLRIVAARLTREGIERALSGGDDARADPAMPPFRAESDPLGLLGFGAWTLERVTGTGRIRIRDGYFSVPGGRKFLLMVEPSAGLSEIGRARELVHSIEQALAGARSHPALAGPLTGKRLVAVGRPVSYVHGFDTLYGDIRRIAIGAAVLVPILIGLLFRNAVAPLVLMLPIVVGLALAAGFAFVAFGSMSLLAWIFVGVLVGLGVDFGVHVTTHYWMFGQEGADRAAAVRSAVLRPGRGIVFGALTSATAFLSLQVMSYPALEQIAWITAVGLLAILAASLVVLPLALSGLPAGRGPGAFWRLWGELFDRAGRRHVRLGLALWVALVAGSLVSARFIPFEPHPWKLALRGNPKSAETARLSEEMGISFTPLLMVSRGGTLGEALARDREATRILRRVAIQAGVASLSSLSGWLPTEKDQRTNLAFVREHTELFSPARFRRDFQDVVARMERPDPYLLEEYLPTVERFLEPDPRRVTPEALRELGLGAELDRHLYGSGGEYAAISYVYLTRFPWAEGAVERFLERFEGAGGGDLAGVRVLGDALRSASHARILRRDAAVATLLVALLISLILWIEFRDPVAMGICLLPLLCGVSAAALTMAALSIELNMLTLTIAPLLIGLGVDDGIHIVERLHAGERSVQVLREAGSSMTITTLTTVATFACLGLARFDGIRDVGLVGSVGLVACLLASLHLVPSCYRMSKG